MPSLIVDIQSEGAVLSKITKTLSEKLTEAEGEESVTHGMASTEKCRQLAQSYAKKAAKHYKTREPELLVELNKVLMDSNIKSAAKTARSILAIIIEGIATRDKSLPSTDPKIQSCI